MMDGAGASESLSLRDAVDRFRTERGASANAYDWWRRSAQRSGRVSFGQPRQLIAGGSTDVPVYKVGNRWIVDAGAFAAAIVEHRAGHAELRYIADAYEQRRLLVPPGRRVNTSWGHYRVVEGSIPLSGRHASRTTTWSRGCVATVGMLHRSNTTSLSATPVQTGVVVAATAR